MFKIEELQTIVQKYLRLPVVNFINILQAASAPVFFCQKITKPNSN